MRPIYARTVKVPEKLTLKAKTLS